VVVGANLGRVEVEPARKKNDIASQLAMQAAPGSGW
jgi:hypothetical protein